MNHRLVILSSLVVFALLLCASGATAEGSAPNAPESPQAAVGTAFTYQGRLDQGGSPASGTYDFRFRLYDDGDAGEGTQLGEVEVGDVSVSSGLFSVELDFGSAFDTGTAAWLEVGVRAGSSTGSYTSLSPRQAVSPTPYALYARRIPLAGSGSANTAARSDHSHDGSYYQNVVVVAKSGGDNTTVQGAIDSITDASEDNPYLVWVAPGEYLESVTMKPYVHLQGADQETTVISSTLTNEDFPPINATLVMTSYITIRDLSIVNNGEGAYSTGLLTTAGTLDAKVSNVKVMAHGNGDRNFAIHTSGGGMTFESVTASSQNGAQTNAGLYNSEGAFVELVDCLATGSGGNFAYGIFNVGANSTVEAKNTNAHGSRASDVFGLFNYNGASAFLEGGEFVGYGPGGDTARGINNVEGSSLHAVHISARGFASNQNRGVLNSGSSADLSYSIFEGDDDSVYSTGTIYLRFSQLKGNTGYFSGTFECAATAVENTFFANSCP